MSIVEDREARRREIVSVSLKSAPGVSPQLRNWRYGNTVVTFELDTAEVRQCPLVVNYTCKNRRISE